MQKLLQGNKQFLLKDQSNHKDTLQDFEARNNNQGEQQASQ